MTSETDAIANDADRSTTAPGERVAADAVVPPELAGYRFDRAAAELFSQHSRAELARWIRAGELTVDGEQAAPKRKLNGGERLLLDGAARELPDWQTAQDVAFEVVHADADLAVINKPAGLVVHPGAGQSDGTLVNGLLQYFAGSAVQGKSTATKSVGGEDPRTLPRAGIVHRLDKDTSGLMLVARSTPALNALTTAIAERAVSREYLAIIEGAPTGGFDVEAPIGRDPGQRTRQAVTDKGKYALTKVRIVERFQAHTLVKATLATGRTHQIRVHLAYRGFPLVGDIRYGAKRRLPVKAEPELVTALQQFSRQALHAWRLGVTHPVSGEPLSFTAEPPADMRELLQLLRAHASS